MTLEYLLDTNVLSEVLRPEPNPGVMERLLAVGDGAATAAPVWHELEFGRERLPAGRRRRAVDAFLAALDGTIVVMSYDAAAARWHARERARMVKAGRTPPFVDGQIAAIAATNDLSVVTRDTRDFAVFRGLRVESWFA